MSRWDERVYSYGSYAWFNLEHVEREKSNEMEREREIFYRKIMSFSGKSQIGWVCELWT